MKNKMSDKKSTAGDADLTDSIKDQDKLKQDITTINLPEVKDIPGQENIKVPDMQEMHDTTISSDDEEAEDLLRDINTSAPYDDDRNLNDVIAQEQEAAKRNPATTDNSQAANEAGTSNKPNKL